MRLAGAIIALIAGIFATFAAGFTLFVGGVGGALRTDNAGLVIALGWGGVAFSFLTIVFGAIGIGNKSKTPGFLLILSSLAGAILGGTFVAVFMALALIGGILVAFGGGSAPSTRPSTSLTPNRGRICAKCSSSIVADQMFCGNCGAAAASLDQEIFSASTGVSSEPEFSKEQPVRNVPAREQKGRRSLVPWFGYGSLGLVIGAVAFFVISAASNEQRSPDSTALADTRTHPSSSMVAPAIETIGAPPALPAADEYLPRDATPSTMLLARIITPDILGTTVAHLEQQVGPAYRTNGQDSTYLLDQCQLIVGSENGTIRNVGVDNYGGECVFPVRQFFGSWLSELGPTFSFGDVFEGTYTASCLRGCGNFADPEAYVFYLGSGADNFVELLAGAPATNQQVIQAMNTWSDALEKKYGEDYVVMGEFQCKENLNKVAEAAFSNIQPSSVRVGYDLNPAKRCQPS